MNTQMTGCASFPEMITEEVKAQYCKDGCLAFHDVLTPREVEEARAAISELIAKGARDPLAHRHRPGQFWIQFEPQFQPAGDESIEALELKVRKLGNYHTSHPCFEYLALRHPRISKVVASLLGDAPLLFQDMALIKPPFIGSEKPWHQDDAYFSVAPLDSVIGVWIALDEATAANGCMHVIPAGHKIGPKRHHHTFDCEIVPGGIDPSDAVPVELPPGGAMFFHGLLPHQTPPNTSPDRRRALQFHYRSASSRILSREEYDGVFVEEDGTPASCAAARK